MVRHNRDYHAQRARDELDLAHEAACESAAQAHIRLSSLHSERAKQMGGQAERDFARVAIR